jgi:1-acyl-sn-glycerol-3-phosphate acyltransferase
LPKDGRIYANVVSPAAHAIFMKVLRITGRLIWLAGVLVSALLDYLFRCAGRSKNSRLKRALWLQRHCRRAVKIFRLKPEVVGPVPARGLLVSNHLGYMDVLVLSSITPVVLLSKRDVKSWPVFGQFAQLAGTIFVDRARRTQVGDVNDEIQSALDDGALVAFFPEGTSSNGQTVLPFRSALLEPAVSQAHPLSISHIQYALDDGDAGDEVCYWGDDTFLPHMLNLMGKRIVRATVRFAPVQSPAADRKELALQLREEVLKLKSQQ